MMGCIGSRLTHLTSTNGHHHRGSSASSDTRYHNSVHSNGSLAGIHNVFPVLNVDDMGRHISPGKLEVTETDLILYIQSKPPLTWPLRTLRRYGYENDLFSFESGRRCPTGPGIYAFKCTRAQSLFNLLQAKIQNNPTATSITLPPPQLPTSNNQSNEGGGGDGAGDESPSTTPGSISPTFDYVNIAEGHALRANSLTGGSLQLDGAQIPGTSTGSTTHPLDPGNSSPGSPSGNQNSENGHPVYMNVDSQPSKPSSGKIRADGKRVRGHRIFNGTKSNSSRTSATNQQQPPPPPLSSIYQNDYLNFHNSSKFLAGSANSGAFYTNIFSPSVATSSANSSTSASSASVTIPKRSVPTIPTTTAPEKSSSPVIEINYAELDLKQIPSHESSNSGQTTTTTTNSRTHSIFSSANAKKSDINSVDNRSSLGVIRSRLKLSKSDEIGSTSSTTSSSSFITNSTSTPSSSSPATTTTATTSLSYAIVQPISSTSNLNNNYSSATASGSSNLNNNNNEQHSSAVQFHHHSPAELGYATIDFDRTAALSIVKRSKIKLNFSHSSSSSSEKRDNAAAHDDHPGADVSSLKHQQQHSSSSQQLSGGGGRKTRHNSTAL